MNSTYHAGHLSQKYQSDKLEPTQSSHDQMQMQFPYIPHSLHFVSQQHVAMPLFTPLQH